MLFHVGEGPYLNVCYENATAPHQERVRHADGHGAQLKPGRPHNTDVRNVPGNHVLVLVGGDVWWGGLHSKRREKLQVLPYDLHLPRVCVCVCLCVCVTSNASVASHPRMSSSHSRPPGCRSRYGSRSYSFPCMRHKWAVSGVDSAKRRQAR